MVGQRFLQLLEGHPWFELKVIAASSKSAGSKYREAAKWMLNEKVPEDISDKTIDNIDSEIFKREGVELIFSALPSEVARDSEIELASSGFKVFSNASAHRMDEDVPLLIADVNPEHIALVKHQKYSETGYIVTNPNCSVTGLATALKPLASEFGINNVDVTTYQALSGAGYPGVPSIEIVGNIVPYIPGEEEKIEPECKKILGTFTTNGIEPLSMQVVANCARVPVRDGHLEAVVVDLDREATVDEIIRAFKNYRGVDERSLPTAADEPIIVQDEENRPQPYFDTYAGSPARARGMAVTVGRIKRIGEKFRFFLLVHNTVRGAAGCSIINAELAKIKNYL
jgi:aspartate-semialdehyde dehydrogenase